MSIEALLLTCANDTLEEIAVTIADVSGEFLKTDMPEKENMT